MTRRVCQPHPVEPSLKTGNESSERWKKKHMAAPIRAIHHGAIETMSRSIKVGEILGKAFDRSTTSRTEGELGDRYLPPRARSFRHSCDRGCRWTLRPQTQGIRWRYCTRWDEGQPRFWNEPVAAGNLPTNDWSGSAVGFSSNAGSGGFAHRITAADAKRVWVGDLRITDSLFELTEQERNQAEPGRRCDRHLYLVGDYELPPPFNWCDPHTPRSRAGSSCRPLFTRSSPKTSTNGCACMTTSMPRSTPKCGWRSEPRGVEASVYRKVDMEIPACINAHAKTLKYRRAKNLLREIQPHTGVARELIRHLLEMDAHAKGTSTRGRPHQRERRTRN